MKKYKISIMFFSGLIFGFFLCKYTRKKTIITYGSNMNWCWMYPDEVYEAKKKALKGDKDSVHALLRYFNFCILDQRQSLYWAKVGEKFGISDCDREIKIIQDRGVSLDVTLEQHFLDGGGYGELKKEEAIQPRADE